MEVLQNYSIKDGQNGSINGKIYPHLFFKPDMLAEVSANSSISI